MPTELPNERSIRRPGSLELDPSSGDIAADETRKLIAASKVVGTSVYSGTGDPLGAIDNVMIDKVSGQVAYALLSSGGFLGLGETRHPIPWNALTYSVELGGYVIDVDPTSPEASSTESTDPLPAA